MRNLTINTTTTSTVNKKAISYWRLLFLIQNKGMYTGKVKETKGGEVLHVINKRLDEVTIDDIYQLKRNGIIESRTLDYKLLIHVEDKYHNSTESRKELMRDLCAFANTDGGDLIIGIREDKGIPVSIEGIDSKNIDSLKLLLDNLIIDGIEPHIQYDIKAIPLRKERFILIIRVYKNWIESPYRTSYKREHRFYGRQSSRKYELDVSELRSRFNFTVKVKEEIEKIRDNGVKKVYHNQHPFNFPCKSILMLHLIPILAFEKRVKLHRVSPMKEYFSPLNATGVIENKWNFDGFLSYNKNNGVENSYAQLYESGVLEVVDSHYLDKDGVLDIDELEKILIHRLKNNYLQGFKELKIQTPIFMYLSLVNVKNLYITDPLVGKIHLDRKNLLFPQIIIHDYKDIENIENIIQPNFELMWRSFGLTKGYSYYERDNLIV